MPTIDTLPAQLADSTFLAQWWPVVVFLAMVIGGLVGFYLRGLEIRKTRLEIAALLAEKRQRESGLHHPTAEEIVVYGKKEFPMLRTPPLPIWLIIWVVLTVAIISAMLIR
jgi:hypothetical protein